ncbi:MAG: 2-polyprenylphenol 6-hydroxylase [Rickettsiaceae bacterium]|nr:2-polyprenylphenol 6-hydroxylase [Rickettsiaceae bacterium]
MKIFRSLLSFVLVLNKSARIGLLCYIGAQNQARSVIFLSFLLAPFSTIYHLRSRHTKNLAAKIEKLGPVFIKFGQSMSSRPDIIGKELAMSLRSLQDNLKPFSTRKAKEIITQELGRPINQLFKNFTDEPIASASISQVHKAELHDGSVVAVKILRPDVELKYIEDIKTIKALAILAKRLIRKFKNIKLLDIVSVFEKTMKSELNFQNEAASCSALYDNFVDDDSVLMPKIFWDYSTRKVLVLEWLEGISIYDIEGLKANGIDEKDVLRKLATSFFNQSFRDGFFHADLHPGNIFITKDGRVAFLDFGIVSYLSERDRLAMAEILYCLIKRDYYRVAEIHMDIGFIPEYTNLHEFAIACRVVGEPIVNQSAHIISIGHLLENLYKMTSEFGMQTQPQLIMLQKTIIVLEGIGKILAPSENMWQLAEPWIKKWATQNLGFDAKIIRAIKNFATRLSSHT